MTVVCTVAHSDVLYCTASNWNLVVIGVDRFTAVTAPIWYRDQRHSARRVLLYVLFDWTFSVLVCVPPTAGFLDLDKSYQFSREQRAFQCTLFTERSYVVYSALGSFLVPLLLLLVLYTRIFLVLHKRASALRAHLPAMRRPVPEQPSAPPPPSPPLSSPPPQPKLTLTTTEEPSSQPCRRASGAKRVACSRSTSTRDTSATIHLPLVPAPRRRAASTRSQNLPDLVLEVQAQERISALSPSASISASVSASASQSIIDSARRPPPVRVDCSSVGAPSSVCPQSNTTPDPAGMQCEPHEQTEPERPQKRLSFQMAVDSAGDVDATLQTLPQTAASQSQESRSSADAEDGEGEEDEEGEGAAKAQVEAESIGKEIRVRNLFVGLPLPTFEPMRMHIERRRCAKPSFVRREAAATRRMLLVLATFLVCSRFLCLCSRCVCEHERPVLYSQ